MFVITSQAYCLPPQKLTNADLAEEFDKGQVGTLCGFLGIEERRIDGDPLKMAYYAARRVLPYGSGADAVIFVSESFKYRIPCNAAILAHALGINPSICLDLSMGCSGFPYGLRVASGLGVKKVLLINADCITKFVKFNDLTLRCLHGDAACATVIERWRSGLKGGNIKTIDLGTIPEAWSYITCKNDDCEYVKMKGAEVGHIVLREIPRILSTYDLEQYNTILFHQANDTVTQMLYSKLGIPEHKQFRFIKTVGNLSNASTPVLMCEAMKTNKITDITRVLVVSFGAGFSWGVLDLKYDGLMFPCGSAEQSRLEQLYGKVEI